MVSEDGGRCQQGDCTFFIFLDAFLSNTSSKYQQETNLVWSICKSDRNGWLGQLLYLKDYEGLFISRIKTDKIRFKRSLHEGTVHFIFYATFVEITILEK